MPLFTAIRTPNNTAQSPEYKQRSIPSITASRISTSGIFSFPLKRQIAYDVYKATIPAFIYATATQTKVRTDAGGYKFSLEFDDLIPFPNLPPLHFRPQTVLSPDDLIKWKDTIGNIVEYEEVPFGKGHVYCTTQVTIESLKKLAKHIAPKMPGPSNTSNDLGMKAMFTWKKIVTAFIATHTYPAFQTDTEAPDVYAKEVMLRVAGAPDSASNRKRALDLVNLAATKRRRTGLTIERETTENVDEMEIDIEHEKDITMVNICLVAKPAPFRPAINHGPVSYVPAMGGQFFPYFHNVLVPDQHYVSDVFRRYFLLNFGDDPTEAAEAFQQWRSEFQSMVYTETGAIAQHMTFGIELALTSQTRLFYIVDQGAYLGFTLLGHHFATMAYTEVHEGLSAESLRKELAEITTHESSLRDLCALLSDLEVVDSEMKELVKPEEISNARQLQREISMRKKDVSSSKKQKFEKALNGIFFEADYLRMTKENVVRALRLIANPDRDELDTLPLFLHRDFIFGDNMIYQVLGAFGPTAPSFVNLAGNRYDLPYTDVEDYAFSTDPTKPDEIQRILVSMKALHISVGDMKKIRDERAIYQNFNERARANRNIEFRKGTGREEIWSALKEYVAGPKPINDAATALGRKDGPSKAKKRKVAEVDDLDDF